MAAVNAEPYEFEFDPKTTALVMIDFQRDFVDPGGFGEALGNDVSLLRRAVAPAERVLKAARDRDRLLLACAKHTGGHRKYGDHLEAYRRFAEAFGLAGRR